jgi:hypothetical protein
VLRRVNDALDARTRIQRRMSRSRERSRRPAPELGRGRAAGPPGSHPASPAAREAARTLDGGLDASRSGGPPPAGARRGELPDSQPPAVELGAGGPGRGEEEGRLDRIARQRTTALEAGNARRAARLAARAQRIEREDARAIATPERRPGATGQPLPGAQDRHARFLDSQARLEPGGDRRRGEATARRSYATLAGIAGYAPREYGQLDGSGKRAAREQIDRELALRRRRAPVSQLAPPETARRATAGRGPVGEARSESDVMRDARDVAAGRKRRLGPDRP